MRIGLFLILLGCTLLVGCETGKKMETPFTIATFSPDELTYPDTTVYIDNLLQEEFVDHFFLPWERNSRELLTIIDSIPGKDFSYLKEYLLDDEWYGENKKPHKKSSREAIVNNVDESGFPNFLKKGMVIAHTDLRRIPTDRPGFATYSKAGEGYPFDYFQETNLWANTPLQLVHLTKDKQWCYVISPYYKGWVAMRDLALVSEGFREAWCTGNYAMPLSDQVNLQHSTSNYALNAKMGMVLPYQDIPDDPARVLVYYATADENQNAKLLKAVVGKDELALVDFEFDRTNLELLVSHLLGQPYGWGGNLENRDCSSMIRDLLATYKIWLPRDSKDQIEIGQQYQLTGNAQEKMELIKEKGIPFLTILRKKGHNMLYVGDAPNGEPLIFHAIWGLKTSYSNKELADLLQRYPIEGVHQEEGGTLRGRYIIGESVITSVMAGAGNDKTTAPLIDEIYAMTNILEQ